MASVTGLTAARMLAIEAESIVGGTVNGAGHLILIKHDGTTIDAGPVVGPTGATGAPGTPGAPGAPGAGISVVTSTTRPGSPTVGQQIYESDTKKGYTWNGTIWVPLGWAPACRITRGQFSGAVALASGSWVPFPFDSESYDNDSMHDNVTNPGRITIKTPGLYRVHSIVRIDPITTGAASLRSIALTVNDAAGTAPVASRFAVGNREFAGAQNSECLLEISALYQFAVNDFIQVALFQNSGVATNMTVNIYPNMVPVMSAQYAGPSV